MDVIRRIPASEVTNAVAELFFQANHRLGEDVIHTIQDAKANERSARAIGVLSILEENVRSASAHDVPICQDTGMAVVFAEVGALVHIEGDTLENAVNAGVARAYVDGKLRCSVVGDPLYHRVNTGDNTPAILHIRTVAGDQLRLIAAPKGFGSENMSAIRMFTPSAREEDIIDFVVDTVRRAGSNPCPPITVGVGIGGDFEGAAILSKRALTRSLDLPNAKPEYARLEQRILGQINALGIGPQGFGGDTTALAVMIETGPTHIAGLPVAVNINCHVVRHAERIL
jgi:fumarate hydratase subunit alpha